MGEKYLIIPDLQLPFHHENAFRFLSQVRREFKIPNDKEHILNVGDEVDNYWGGLWKKSIEASHTANQELKCARDNIKELASIFPEMRLCVSNHGSRWARKALDAEIPSQLLRGYKEMLGAPDKWSWHDRIEVKGKHRFIVEHGDRISGSEPYRKALEVNGVSTVIGHHHTSAGIVFVRSTKDELSGIPFQWGMCVGALIDHESYAFEYARGHAKKPMLGCGVVLEGGLRPMWIAMT